MRSSSMPSVQALTSGALQSGPDVSSQGMPEKHLLELNSSHPKPTALDESIRFRLDNRTRHRIE
jgi:hypothetical protein